MTLGLKITNNFSAPLAAGINSAATTVTLSAGYGARLTQYAAGEYEYMTLVDQSNNMEIVKVTARTGDILTIIRAQDGTSARDFIVGDICTSRPCRAALYDAMEVNLAKANVDSQAFTGTPSLPTGTTGVTQTQGNNSTKLATTAYTDAAKAAAIAYVDAAITANASIGVGQTWQDMTGSRTITTVYQNLTGKPIMVSIICQGDGANNILYVGAATPPTLAVDHEISAGTAGASRHALQAIVPPNHYYKMTSASAAFIKSWLELR